ncbi:MAG: hypothetical protein KTR27_05495 [Leptolyngbyaceae cyanobacterium MAG.088]|nr:hypothetical protein [Leptolyngbyaceae cyanobacterium MAG.088]
MTKKLVIRLILLLGLIVPFLLREMNNSLEPYPAVLQPSGATKISTSEGLLKFSRTELIIICSNGSEKSLDPNQFFDTIPTQYWTHIARNGFGFNEPKSKSVSLGIWTLQTTTVLKASPEDKKAALEWMHKQLKNLDIEDAETLRVQQVKTVFNLDKRITIKSEIIAQSDVELH